MSNLRATILHISDLHFGRRFFFKQINEDIVRTLESLATTKKITPDFLIVSGDVAEHPSPFAMRKAYDFICKLAKAANIAPENAMVIPGNHDYKRFGNVGLRRLTRIPFEIYFRKHWGEQDDWDKRLAAVRGERGKRWWRYIKYCGNALWPTGKGMRDKILKISDKERRLAIFGMNSTPLFEWFGMATGKVSNAHIQELRESVQASEKEPGEADVFKIVVVHHHPLPIRHDRESGLVDSLMVFHNAGIFLEAMIEEKFDLVLHGHKHRSGFSRITYDYLDETRYTLCVLAAGSTTCKKPSDPQGNGFNVIKIYDDDTVKVDQLFCTEDGSLQEGTPHYFLCDLNDVRERRKNREWQKFGLAVGHVTKTVTLTREGYSEVEIQLHNCKVLSPDGKDLYEIVLKADRPVYVRGLELSNTAIADAEIDYNRDSSPWSLKGQITFQKRLRGDPLFSLAYRYRLMNGHALSLKEFRRKFSRPYLGEKLNWEIATIECEKPADYLKLEVRFPEGFDMETIQDVQAAVFYRPGTDTCLPHDRETSRIRNQVRRLKNGFLLDLPSPISGFLYRIQWKYKDATDTTPRETKIKLHDIRKRLIETGRRAKANASDSVYKNLVNKLEAFLCEVEKIYPEKNFDDQLNISLAVFDDTDAENPVLRFVATNFGLMDKLFDEEMWLGEGCQGFAFETGKAVFTFSDDPRGLYLSPAEIKKLPNKQDTALLDCNNLLSIPWIDETGIPMGIVNISSTEVYSRLTHLTDLDEVKKSREEKNLKALTQILGSSIIKGLF